MRSENNDWPVWDWPVRVIHWYFPVAIGFMWWSAEQGEMLWHSRVGYSVLVLTLTRLVWGFVGSYHARFASFLRGPNAVIAYLRGAPLSGVGHNPAGGWSALLLLIFVSTQAMSGLFASDDILFEGPLAYWAGDWSSRIGAWHEVNWTILSTLVVLHLLAISFYWFVKKEPLVSTMIRGRALGRSSAYKPVSGFWALAVGSIISLMLWALVYWAPVAPSYY